MSVVSRLQSITHLSHYRKFWTFVKAKFTNKKTIYLAASLLFVVVAVGSVVSWKHHNTAPISRTITHVATQKPTAYSPSITTATPSTVNPTVAQSPSNTTTPPKVTATTRTPAQQSTPKSVVITPTITLGLGSFNTLHITTQNFSSPSYLVVIHPVQSTHYTTDKITGEGFSISSSPYGGPLPMQIGSLLLNTALGEFMSAGEVYTVTVCANVNGSCGLSSNTVTATITQVAPPHP